MDGMGLDPNDIFLLPSFKKNKLEQVRQIQLDLQSQQSDRNQRKRMPVSDL